MRTLRLMVTIVITLFVNNANAYVPPTLVLDEHGPVFTSLTGGQLWHLDAGLELTGYNRQQGGYTSSVHGDFTDIAVWGSRICGQLIDGTVTCARYSAPTRQYIITNPGAVDSVQIAVGVDFVSYIDDIGDFHYKVDGQAWVDWTSTHPYTLLAASSHFVCNGADIPTTMWADATVVCHDVSGNSFNGMWSPYNDFSIDFPYDIAEIAVNDHSLYALSTTGIVGEYPIDVPMGTNRWTYNYSGLDIVAVGETFCVQTLANQVDCQTGNNEYTLTTDPWDTFTALSISSNGLGDLIVVNSDYQYTPPVVVVKPYRADRDQDGHNVLDDCDDNNAAVFGTCP